MKKSGITFVFVLIIVLAVVVAFMGETTVYAEYLRIHIRANSNSERDQTVKLYVRDKVVDYLTPVLSGCDTKEQALKTLNDELKNVEKVCNAALKEKGFNYTSSARVKNEKFPTRIYDGLTLEGGLYDALIIELGSGEGDNWWCVAYPPLCFTKANVPYIYKSKIYEIIKRFFG